MTINKKSKVKSKIISIYAISIIIACVLFYLLIPYLLNYAPGTINTPFDKQVSGGLYYYQQILIASSTIFIAITGLLFYRLRDINNYPLYMQNKQKYKDKIEKIQAICLSLPNRLFLGFVILPLLLSVFVLFLQTSYLTASDFKLMLVLFILSTTTISIANTFTRKIFSRILIDLENTSFSKIKKTSLVVKLLYQLLPLLAVCIVFTYLLVTAIYQKNNADMLAAFYNNEFKSFFEKANISDEVELQDMLTYIELNNKEDVLFIEDSNFNVVYQTGELTEFFKKYSAELSLKNGYRIYNYYGTSGEGVLYPITLQNGEKYYIGASYTTFSDETISFITSLLLGLGIICSIILYAFASELSKNIIAVNSSLEEIAKNSENMTDKELYVTSADEIGDLIKTYNKIQQLTVEHLNQIHNSQETLMERERLASLGQLIGGIAHNLKTPIMSISGAAEGIKDLVNEFDNSIGNSIVTEEDYHEIAKDMREWLYKIKSYTEYMSDILTAVKGQAVTLNNEDDMRFTIGELFKRIDILMKHELKQSVTYLNVSMLVDDNIEIFGNVNSLVQVINNMISNSIQAYNGKKEQTIDLIASIERNNIVITVRDYGPGLPSIVLDKLFKEMITTKGKNGTGLGLYMSYSTIKAHFNGDIEVESVPDKGTTFRIILPLK